MQAIALRLGRALGGNAQGQANATRWDAAAGRLLPTQAALFKQRGLETGRGRTQRLRFRCVQQDQAVFG